MAGENLKLLVDRIDGLFEKSEAIDGGSEDGVQIVVIGLVVAMLFDRLFERQHGELKTAAVVFDVGRLREHVPVEIGEPPCGSRFGTVNGDDTKPLRPDGLHTLLNNSLRSAEYRLFESL